MPNRFRFGHVLTHDAAYSALLRSNRELLHSAAADALAEQLVPGSAEESDGLAQLTEQLAAARRWEEAHARCCELLLVRASAGLFKNWERWVARAEEYWTAAHPQAEPAAEKSADLLNALALRQRVAGDLQRTADLAQLALANAISAHYPAAEARSHSLLGTFYRTLARMDEARTEYDAALALAERCGLPQLAAEILTSYAGLLAEGSDFVGATDKAEQAMQLRVGLGDKRGIAATLMAQATILRLTGGSYEDSLAMRYRALELAREVGSRLLEGWLLGNIANALSERGSLDQAEPVLRQALALMHEIGDRSTEALFHNNLGVIYGLLGRRDEERLSYERALAGQRATGEMRAAANTLTNLGALQIKIGQPANAARFLDEAAEITASMGDQLSLASALGYRAAAALALSLPDEAEAVLEQAELALADCGDAAERAVIQLRWAQLWQARGDSGRARQALSQAEEFRVRSATPDGADLALSIAAARAQLEDAADDAPLRA